MTLQIPHGMMKKSREITVHEVSADVAMKYTQLFDELPPLFQVSVLIFRADQCELLLTRDSQTFLKVLTMASKGGFFPGACVSTVWSTKLCTSFA